MKRWHILFISIILVSAILLCYVWVPDDVSVPECYQSQNAAWIGVEWVSEEHDEADVEVLVKDAGTRDIQVLYTYTSYLRADSQFNPTYDHASEFVRAVHHQSQDIAVLAWVGIPLHNKRQIGVQGWVDLSDANTRQQIVAFLSMLVEEARFDGIHLNVETVYNHDPYFLLLLEEIRAAVGQEPILSIAGSHWMPVTLNLPPLKDFRWTGDYYRQVTQHVDQIAVMTYDSHTVHPALYRFWMREEIKGLHRNLPGFDGAILIGISVSEEQTSAHQPNVENLRTGLAGLCAALNKDNDQFVSGVAIYADWDFSAEDWAIWSIWQGK